MREPLLCRYFLAEHFLALLHRRQQAAFGLVLVVRVLALAVDLQETFELQHLAGGDELFRPSLRVDDGRGLFHAGIGHLAGEGAFPYQVVQAFLLGRAADRLALHVGGADGLVGFLCAFGVGVVVAGLVELFAHPLHDGRAAALQAEVGKVHRVGTHVGDETGLVQPLRHAHRLSDGESQFAGGLLLEGGGGEGRCRHPSGGPGGHAGDGEAGRAAAFKKRLCFAFGLEAGVQFGLECLVCAVRPQAECGGDAIGRLAPELLYLAFAFHDETHRHALHAAGGETGTHLAPEHGRELEAHQTVEHAAGLLGVDKVEVDVTGMFDGGEDGRFRDLVEHDAARLFRVESQHLGQMPRYGFSFAVLIGSQPDGFRLAGL